MEIGKYRGNEIVLGRIGPEVKVELGQESDQVVVGVHRRPGVLNNVQVPVVHLATAPDARVVHQLFHQRQPVSPPHSRLHLGLQS